MLSTGPDNDFICNSATSSLRHTSMQRFRVRSLILSNFLVVCSFLIPSTMRSRIKLSRKQSQKLHVLARFLNSATKLSTDFVGSLSCLAMFLHFSHYNAPITRVLSLSVVECFDDFQRIISDCMFEHRQLKLRGFPIQTRNDKIIVIFLLPKLPVFGNFSKSRYFGGVI